jgi:hypothetical protein
MPTSMSVFDLAGPMENLVAPPAWTELRFQDPAASDLSLLDPTLTELLLDPLMTELRLLDSAPPVWIELLLDPLRRGLSLAAVWMRPCKRGSLAIPAEKAATVAPLEKP